MRSKAGLGDTKNVERVSRYCNLRSSKPSFHIGLVQFTSVQFKMVSMCSGKPMCAGLSEGDLSRDYSVGIVRVKVCTHLSTHPM